MSSCFIIGENEGRELLFEVKKMDYIYSLFVDNNIKTIYSLGRNMFDILFEEFCVFYCEDLKIQIIRDNSSALYSEYDYAYKTIVLTGTEKEKYRKLINICDTALVFSLSKNSFTREVELIADKNNVNIIDLTKIF